MTLVENVKIYREHRVEIVFRWQNEYEWLAGVFSKAGMLSSEKEVV